MGFSWNPNTKCTEKPQSSISTHIFFDVSSFSKISPPPPLSFNISLRDTSFHISLNSLGFYLSPECLLNFLWIVHSTMCGEIFSIYDVHPLKTPGRIFWKFVCPRRKGSRKLWFALWKLVYLYVMIYNFSKCDGFTVLWIISIKQCGIKFIVSSLKPW